MRPINGFTLIEMMIAISLGLAVVYVAFAGFRVATQAITITNRLARENAMLRTGCDVAHERLDFWTDFDDPNVSPLETPTLRAVSDNPMGGKEGMPFTPMSLVMPLVPNPMQPERATGWDPDEQWKASDPRIWWHGNVAEKFQSELVLGRYGIFANTRSNARIAYVDTRMPPPPWQTDYGTVEVPHSWQYNQVWNLHNALGYYGFADYMPANTLFACYGDYVPPAPGIYGTSFDGMPLVLFKPGTTFDNGEGGQEYPKGLWRLTMYTSYAVQSPTNGTAPSIGGHQQYYRTGYNSNAGQFRTFLDQTENRRDLVTGARISPVRRETQPGHWPQVTVTTQRFIKTARFVNLCRVTMVDPLTGERSELAFTAFATTLRGARLQRRHPDKGGGWARWDDTATATNDQTLDHTP